MARAIDKLSQPHTSIDESVSSISLQTEQLSEQLHRDFSKAGLTHVLLLTGPAMLEAFPADTHANLRAAGVPIHTLPIRHPRIDAIHCPQLLKLDLTRSSGADVCRAAVRMALEDWQAESLKRAKGHRIGAFLATDSPTEKVAGRLARIALQPRPGGGTRLLSLADPAAFECVWSVLSDRQRACLLGPISRWRVLNRARRWQDYPFGDVLDPSAEPAPPAALGLSDDQWSELADVRPANRAWARARAANMPVTEDDFRHVFGALKRARSHGIDDDRDLSLYAFHALTLNPHFDLHPRIRSLLQSRKSDISYSLTVAALGDADWADIRDWRVDPSIADPVN